MQVIRPVQTLTSKERRYFVEMEATRLALVALVTALLCFPAFSQYASGSGEESTNQTTLQEGFVITQVDSKPKGKAYRLDDNTAILLPLQGQQVQKWRIYCPETLDNETLKLVFFLAHANLEAGDYLQFNRKRYEGSKSTPTAIAFNSSRQSLLVSYVTEEGNSSFQLGYVCPYSNYQNCTDFHNCPAVANYAAESAEAYYTLAYLCYNPLYIDQAPINPYLCQILQKASTCGLPVPNPLPTCD